MVVYSVMGYLETLANDIARWGAEDAAILEAMIREAESALAFLDPVTASDAKPRQNGGREYRDGQASETGRAG